MQLENTRLSAELKHLLNADFISIIELPEYHRAFKVAVAYELPLDCRLLQTVQDYEDTKLSVIKSLSERISKSAVQSENELLELKLQDSARKIEQLEINVKELQKYEIFYKMYKGLKVLDGGNL